MLASFWWTSFLTERRRKSILFMTPPGKCYPIVKCFRREMNQLKADHQGDSKQNDEEWCRQPHSGAQRVTTERVLGWTFYIFIDDHEELNSTWTQFIIGIDLWVSMYIYSSFISAKFSPIIIFSILCFKDTARKVFWQVVRDVCHSSC